MKACFIGHKTIEKTEELIASLRETITALIRKGVTTFLFGSMSEFDKLSWEIVTEIQHTHPYIKRVYVRANYEYIEASYEKYLLQLYEETYFPKKIENAGKYSYIERNYEMIDRSTYCIFYYNENYVALSQQKSKHSLFTVRRSGTKTSYQYAIQKGKVIINLYTPK